MNCDGGSRCTDGSNVGARRGVAFETESDPVILAFVVIPPFPASYMSRSTSEPSYKPHDTFMEVISVIFKTNRKGESVPQDSWFILSRWGRGNDRDRIAHCPGLESGWERWERSDMTARYF
jgi:hypothetical protein